MRDEQILDDRLTGELLKLCGAAAFMKLTESYGGTRLFVPAGSKIESGLFHELGKSAAKALAQRYGGSYLRVPLARDWRALHYSQMGASHARIARALGMTESGVDKLMARLKRGEPQVKAKGHPDQMSLFSQHFPKKTG